MPGPLGRAGFAAIAGVSRETLDRLQTYVDLVEKWNRAINLVSPATIDDIWRRHILDSWQLTRRLRRTASVADLGSGAGLPGLILAILGQKTVHLIESDQRKAVFLQEAARVTATAVTIHAQRIANVDPLGVDIITARALAPVGQLLAEGAHLLVPGGVCYFLKGARVAEELTEARTKWTFDATLIPSLSDETGSIVKLENIAREH